MINNLKFKTQLKCSIILSLIFVSGMFIFFPTNVSDSPSESSELKKNDDISDNIDIYDTKIIPKLSADEVRWWDASWTSRQLINVSNPNSNTLLDDYGVSIEFNYTKLVLEGSIKADLSDLRIIEYNDLGEPYRRNYYYQINYPIYTYATVWFDTDIAAGADESDVYLYYGNDAAVVDSTYFCDDAADSFGWIKNGDFELENKTGNKIDHVLGWNWTDDPVDEFDKADEGNIEAEVNYVHRLETESETTEQERTFGDNSFKWGDIDSRIYSKDNPTNGHEQTGTLFSYPFLVPGVTPGESIYLNAYRNIRVWDSGPKYFGYFIRVCSNYGTDVDAHASEIYGEWYQTIGKSSQETVLQNMYYPTEPNKDTLTTAMNGGLTGPVQIDVTAFAGDPTPLMVEFGMYGEEGPQYTAFGNIDDVEFSYSVDVVLDPNVEERSSDVVIITKDTDGRLMPTAKVTFWNFTDPVPENREIKTQTTSSDEASTVFVGMTHGDYNITVNYTLVNSGVEACVYDSRDYNLLYTIESANHTFNLRLNMSTIDFEIVDYGLRPLVYSYINISNTKADAYAGNVLEKLRLVDGKATFRWKNQSRYYYQIFYDNDDFNFAYTPLNESYIYRSDYVNAKNTAQQIKVNETSAPGLFSVSERVYTNLASSIGNSKILNATVRMTKMDNEISEVSIYYIDENDLTPVENLIYHNDSYSGGNEDYIEFDLTSYDAYGLLIDVSGENASRCDGLIEIDFVETWNIYNVTEITRFRIQTTFEGDPTGANKILINATIPGLGVLKFNMTSWYNISDDNDPRNGFALTPNGLDMLYLRGISYNISLYKSQIREFNVTVSDQWHSDDFVWTYNYTLINDDSYIVTDITLGGAAPEDFMTKFAGLNNTDIVTWGEKITVNVTIYYSNDGGSNWAPLTNPDWVKVTFRTTGIFAKDYYIANMVPGASPGNFTFSFYSSNLSAGNQEVSYRVIISGHKSEYDDPPNVEGGLIVVSLPTGIDLHETDGFAIIENNQLSQFYGEEFNLTVRFYDNDTKNALEVDSITYNWLNQGHQTGFVQDPIDSDYYTLTLDTSLAGAVGPQVIMVSAFRENHTAQINIPITIYILDRETFLSISGQSGQSQLLYIVQKVWVGDEKNFTFTYTDKLTTDYIGNAETLTYTWQQVTSEGLPTGRDGTGELIPTQGGKNYTLDFNTEILSIGFYYIYINIKKSNYELRAALINLEIKLRTMTIDLGGDLEDDQVNVVQGNDIEIEISLMDTSRNIPLTGAIVKIEFDDETYTFTEESPGLYTLTIETDDIDAFFTSQTFTCDITIEKADFVTIEEEITVVVEMEEIYDGMPTFYFLMIACAIIGIIGSLSSYRIIQQARIPKFVKKIRSIKKSIKGKHSIKSVYVPSKADIFYKEYGKEWKEIGLSLEDILGVKDKKTKLLDKAKSLIKPEEGEQ